MIIFSIYRHNWEKEKPFVVHVLTFMLLGFLRFPYFYSCNYQALASFVLITSSVSQIWKHNIISKSCEAKNMSYIRKFMFYF